MDKLQYVIYSICRSVSADFVFRGFAKQDSISFMTEFFSFDREVMTHTVSQKKTTGFFFLNHTLYAQPDCPNSCFRISFFFFF